MNEHIKIIIPASVKKDGGESLDHLEWILTEVGEKAGERAVQHSVSGNGGWSNSHTT